MSGCFADILLRLAADWTEDGVFRWLVDRLEVISLGEVFGVSLIARLFSMCSKRLSVKGLGSVIIIR